MRKPKILVLGVALIGGGCFGMLAGCGTTKTITVDQVRTETDTQTITVPHIITKTVTKTVTAAPTPDVNNQESEGAQSFSGNGDKRLGTIRVAKDSIVKWTNDGEVFGTYDKEDAIAISSQAHSGTSDLPAGTYTEVGIIAVGNWTFKIEPR